MNQATKFTRGIEEYTGRKVTDLNVSEDPKVADTWALRATFEDGKTADFLLVGQYFGGGTRNMTPGNVCDNLEEAEFKTWPPISGALKFFH